MTEYQRVENSAFFAAESMVVLLAFYGAVTRAEMMDDIQVALKA